MEDNSLSVPCWREELARAMMGSVAAPALLCAGESSLSCCSVLLSPGLRRMPIFTERCMNCLSFLKETLDAEPRGFEGVVCIRKEKAL